MIRHTSRHAKYVSNLYFADKRTQGMRILSLRNSLQNLANTVVVLSIRNKDTRSDADPGRGDTICEKFTAYQRDGETSLDFVQARMRGYS